MRKLLDTEAAISLEAKAALEEAQALLTAARTDATQQLARLRRELCARDERVRCLEAKLNGKADGTVRSSALQAVGQDSAGTGTNVLRISRAGSTGHGGGAIACMDGRSSLDALLHELAPHENVIELIVKDAELEARLCMRCAHRIGTLPYANPKPSTHLLIRWSGITKLHRYTITRHVRSHH